MTTIGEIRLHFKRRHANELHYESEKGNYRLVLPAEADFANQPDYIDVKIATEDKWIRRDKVPQ